MNAAEIARSLGGRKARAWWSCRCPAHDDHHLSLAVRDAGRLGPGRRLMPAPITLNEKPAAATTGGGMDLVWTTPPPPKEQQYVYYHASRARRKP